eukprot:1148392-Pelagomonas_calceolata.AAC.6
MLSAEPAVGIEASAAMQGYFQGTPGLIRGSLNHSNDMRVDVLDEEITQRMFGARPYSLYASHSTIKHK